MSTMKVTRDLNVSQNEQKRLMRELKAANADMQRIKSALSNNKGVQGAHQARAIAHQWLADRGLLNE